MATTRQPARHRHTHSDPALDGEDNLLSDKPPVFDLGSLDDVSQPFVVKEEEDFAPEVLLIQENQKLKKKVAALKKVLLNDKTHKLMKEEVLELSKVLKSIEEYLN